MKKLLTCLYEAFTWAVIYAVLAYGVKNYSGTYSTMMSDANNILSWHGFGLAVIAGMFSSAFNTAYPLMDKLSG